MPENDTRNDYCGQTQPHAAHIWQSPPAFGVATYIQTHQCAGVASTDS